MGVPTEPECSERLLMDGEGSSVKATPLLATPPTVTTRLPVVAPDGTGAVIDVAPHAVGAAVVPLKVTLLVPWLVPKSCARDRNGSRDHAVLARKTRDYRPGLDRKVYAAFP